MIWNTLEFVLRETGLHLRRERLIAIATVSTVAVLLVLLGTIVFFLLDLRAWTHRMADELEIWGFFDKDVPREDALKASEPIGAWPEVRSVKFVTKEEGWERQRQTFAGSAAFRDIENPLPDAVRIKAREPEQVANVAHRLEEVPGIHTVNWGGSLARSLVKFKRAVDGAGIVASLLALVAGVFIVHNTIRLGLHSRWREIYIMQLVGATRSLIAVPFLLEGMLHGTLGAALACCVLIPAHMYLRSLTARSAPFLLLAPDSILLPSSLGLLLVGALLGVTGSTLSVRRYLRQKPEWQG
jgi:cell division transport system permease protein